MGLKCTFMCSKSTLFTINLCCFTVLVVFEGLSPSSSFQTSHGINCEILRLAFVALSNLGRGCAHPWFGELPGLYWDIISSTLYCRIFTGWNTRTFYTNKDGPRSKHGRSTKLVGERGVENGCVWMMLLLTFMYKEIIMEKYLLRSKIVISQ